MMAKKAGEVNMEEGQIRWPKGQWDSVLSYYGSGSASAKGFWSISLEQPTWRGQSSPQPAGDGGQTAAVNRRRRQREPARRIRPARGGQAPAQTPGLGVPEPTKGWLLGGGTQSGGPA